MNTLTAQERFFSFVEGWVAYHVIEYEQDYNIVGMNFTLDPTYIKYIQFSKLDKSGNILSEWDYRIDSVAVTTEIRNQQSFSTFGDKHLLGITSKSPPDFALNAEQLTLDGELQVTERSMLFEDAIMYITHQIDNNKILYATDDFENNTVNSTLVSTDTLGNVIWESNFSCGGTYCWMEPRHIHAAHDGGYIFTNNERRGFAEGGIVGELDIGTIIKTDSLGVQQWRIRPGGVGEPYDSGHILLQSTDDGNYLCAWVDNFWKTTDGSTFDHYNRNPNVTIWFAKIAPDGTKLWEKNITEEIELWDISDVFYLLEQMIRLSDGNFVILYQDGIVKINQEAEVIWARRLNPVGFESSDEQPFYYVMKGISHTYDDGLIITGEFGALPGTMYDEFTQLGFVLKLDEYGCLEADCQEDDPVSIIFPQLSVREMSIYPNPARESITLSYDIGQSASRISLSVTDVAGRMVHEQALTGIVGSVQIDTQAWASGVYLCQLMVDGYVGGVRRIVVTH